MIDHLVAVIKRRALGRIGRAFGKIAAGRKRDAIAIEKFRKLRALHGLLALHAQVPVNGAGYRRLERSRTFLRGILYFNETRLYETFLFLDYLGLDLLAGESARNKNHSSVAEPAEAVSAVNGLGDIN